MTNTENVKKPAKTPRVDMPCQPAAVRAHNFKEVALGDSRWNRRKALRPAVASSAKTRAAVRGVRLKSVFPNSSLKSSRVT